MLNLGPAKKVTIHLNEDTAARKDFLYRRDFRIPVRTGSGGGESGPARRRLRVAPPGAQSDAGNSAARTHAGANRVYRVARNGGESDAGPVPVAVGRPDRSAGHRHLQGGGRAGGVRLMRWILWFAMLQRLPEPAFAQDGGRSRWSRPSSWPFATILESAPQNECTGRGAAVQQVKAAYAPLLTRQSHHRRRRSGHFDCGRRVADFRPFQPGRHGHGHQPIDHRLRPHRESCGVGETARRLARSQYRDDRSPGAGPGGPGVLQRSGRRGRTTGGASPAGDAAADAATGAGAGRQQLEIDPRRELRRGIGFGGGVGALSGREHGKGKSGAAGRRDRRGGATAGSPSPMCPCPDRSKAIWKAWSGRRWEIGRSCPRRN